MFCVFYFNFFPSPFKSSREFCILKQVAPSWYEIFGYIGSAKFCSSLSPPASVVLFFWIYMQKTYICLCIYRIVYKYIYECTNAWFSSLFPTKSNVLERMDYENSINILLSLFFKKGRGREELFNIRPSFGCTLSTTKYLWLQIRCKRGLERKVRELPASTEPGVYFNPGNCQELPTPCLSLAFPTSHQPCPVLSSVRATFFQFHEVKGGG